MTFHVSRVLQFCLLFMLIGFLAPLHLDARKQGAKPVAQVGDALQVALPAFAASMTVVKWDTHGMLQFVESFGSSQALVHVLKPVINERRPRGGWGSFPSGHTAAAFGGAAFLQMRYGWAYGIPCYLLASYVGFSRVYAQKHWFMDVLGGAAIAVSTNVLFTRPYKEKKITVTPILDSDCVGLCLSLHL